MDIAGFLREAYFTPQWYTPWLLMVSAVAAVFGAIKERNPLICFAVAYFLSPVGALIYIFCMPEGTGQSRGNSMGWIVVAVVLGFGGLAFWRLTSAAPRAGQVARSGFQPQVVTLRRAITVSSVGEASILLAAGTQVWAAAREGDAITVRLGSVYHQVPLDAVLLKSAR